MKYLGLDLGTRTLGISISDTTKTIASAYGTIHFQDDDYETAIQKLSTIIQKEPIEALVLGFPKNMNGTVGPRALNTLEFKKKLEETGELEQIGGSEYFYDLVEIGSTDSNFKKYIEYIKDRTTI